MAKSSKNVLFLCTGNFFRSRYAEILFNSLAVKMSLPWQASSRGLALERGVNNVGPMAVSAVKALEARGLRAVAEFGRFPIQATAADFESANWIVALKEADHQPLLHERFPAWAEKVEFWDIDDAPDILVLIERDVMDLAARLIGGGRKRVAPLPEVAVTFRFADNRLIPRFHLEGVQTGRRVSVFKIDLGTGERISLLATATVGEGGWVDLPEPIIGRAGEAFIAIPEIEK